VCLREGEVPPEPSYIFCKKPSRVGQVFKVPPKPKRKSGNTKTFEQKSTKETKETKGHRIQSARPDPWTAQTSPCQTRFSSLRYLRCLLFKIFSSVVLLESCLHRIWCQSSSDFARLRPILVIHRVLSVFPSCSIEFDAVRPTSNPIISRRHSGRCKTPDSS
jgi:hypothetical protein